MKICKMDSNISLKDGFPVDAQIPSNSNPSDEDEQEIPNISECHPIEESVNDPIPLEIVIKEEVPDQQESINVWHSLDIKEDDMSSISEKQDIGEHDIQKPSTKSKQEKSLQTKQCLFCSQDASDKQQEVDWNNSDSFREMVNFVLATSLKQPKLVSCNSCIQMFEMFYNFKKSCLMTLKRSTELIDRRSRKRKNSQPETTSANLNEISQHLTKTIIASSESKQLNETENCLKEPCENSESEPDTSTSTVRRKRSAKTATTFYCELCPETFRSAVKLEYHVNVHKGVKEFKCRVGCERTYYGQADRTRHEWACKKPVAKLMCDICGVILSGYGSYWMHMERHKGNEYQCEKCHMKFKLKKQLIRHALAHSDERKYECQVCHKKFKSSYANRVHQRIHTNEKPYQCKLCGERFTYHGVLKAHMERGHV
ncbi:zinc finger protein 679-like [Uranotaenia lowii]|uniref:zinc finger protein 679-like n=1 Tax=Uranotaenia lowii TaxID=190385 RepID=UPI00247B11E7|nr:zinc finger protein 679-like [Uranotaenia lowii]